jgi:hypothetical protein
LADGRRTVLLERVTRDALAILVWIGAFVAVGTGFGLVLVTTLDDLLLEAPVLGYVVNALVILAAGTAGAVAARRFPQPRPGVAEPRWVVMAGPVLVAFLSVLDGAWDGLVGALLAAAVTWAFL